MLYLFPCHVNSLSPLALASAKALLKDIAAVTGGLAVVVLAVVDGADGLVAEVAVAGLAVVGLAVVGLAVVGLAAVGLAVVDGADGLAAGLAVAGVGLLAIKAGIK